MDLSRLSEKYKRAADWQNCAGQESCEARKSKVFLDLLRIYRACLERAWKSGEISAGDLLVMDNLERELDEMHEALRLSAG